MRPCGDHHLLLVLVCDRLLEPPHYCHRCYRQSLLLSLVCSFRGRMEPYDVIVNQPVVIDNGSGVIKAGFAGDQVTQT